MVNQTTEKPTVIALVGCTGSGKSGLGVQLAEALDTEIISVDSMAVFRGMDIGTAKATLEERRGIPHHLLDVANPDEPFTVADFLKLCRPIIARLHAQGKPTLLVGGTGLYLRALLHGLFEGPGPAPLLREELENDARVREAAGETQVLHGRLQAVDPVLAKRLHPNDHVRILRALEVFHSTGRPLSAWQAEHAFAESPYRFIKLALDLDRELLYRRIDARVDAMIARGLERETAGLLETYGPDIKPMGGLGYLHFVRRLQGIWSLEETVDLLKRDTRRFARRQLTWFRGEQGTQWIAPEFASVLEVTRKFVEM